jgi:hypothetical protein
VRRYCGIRTQEVVLVLESVVVVVVGLVDNEVLWGLLVL